MANEKSMFVFLLVVSTILGGIGQFLFKYGLSTNSFLITFAAGLSVYGISTAIYFYVLSRTHLSWAYGLTGISYIVATIFAATILMENVTLLRWSGILVIAFGVILVSFS